MTDESADEVIEYDVVLSNDALFVYLNITRAADAEAIDNILALLGCFPYLGHLYDPLYEAARLPFDLYVMHAGHYDIYYEVSEELKTVSIIFIEDQRRDPNNRFSDIQRFYGRMS